MLYLFLIGRVLFGGFFIRSGIKHFTHVGMMKGYAASKGVPAPALGVLGSGLFLFLGGLSVLLGAYVQAGVALLVLFLVIAAFWFHDFWNVTDPQQKMMQEMLFARNIVLVGSALLLLSIPTPWVWSI